MNKRGAYFFVLDALIAGTVLIAAVMFIFGTYSITPESDPTFRATEDLLKYVTSTKIREYDSVVTINMIGSGKISNLDNTLLEQMVEFYFKGDSPSLKNFTEDIATGIVPTDRGLIIILNSTAIYNSTLHKQVKSLNESNLVISSKRLSFKRINETVIYGPVWLEVKVWA